MKTFMYLSISISLISLTIFGSINLYKIGKSISSIQKTESQMLNTLESLSEKINDSLSIIEINKSLINNTLRLLSGKINYSISAIEENSSSVNTNLESLNDKMNDALNTIEESTSTIISTIQESNREKINNDDLINLETEFSLPQFDSKATDLSMDNFDIRDLDKIPILKVPTPPRYPQRLLTRGIEGHVIAEFIVNKSGDVESIEIIESTDIGFELSVIECLGKWKFFLR